MQNKILIISHAHPDFSKGGGEIAAYNLFKQLQKRKNCEAMFLARHSVEQAEHLGTPISNYQKKDEYLIYSHTADYINHSQTHKKNLWKYFKEFLEYHQPNIVHLHHYLHFGIEILRVIRNTLPNTKLVLTLHEYIAICHHNGQMVKTKSFELCQSSLPIKCHQCFPKISPDDFFLREQYLKSFFKLVDTFISPSQFLMERYIDWGVPKNKIHLIENGQSSVNKCFTEHEQTGKKIRFGFFGQLSQLKGINVLLNAFEQISKQQRKQCHLSLYGSGLKYQSKKFQNNFSKRIKKNVELMSFYGSYQQEEIYKLMQTIDWVIIPSIWWENSPLVIQEAFNHKKPVICSNIGGMEEKVQHNINGLHFRVGDASSLAEKIGHIIQSSQNSPKFYLIFKKNIPSVSSIEECTEHHLKLYRDNYPNIGSP